LFEWVRELNRKLANHSLTHTDAASALAAWERIDSVLGIGTIAQIEAPAELSTLLEARQAARAAKDFRRGDAIRDELKARGWVIEDTPKGSKLKKI
jgi:cysteinyl-tRNA synthetase